MKIIVCGGRNYSNYEYLSKVLDLYHNRIGPFTEVIEGAANGADALAGKWAAERKIKLTPVPANWNEYGNRAGWIRNIAMADMEPDMVIAFPGGKGTLMMTTIAKERGIRVISIE